MRLYFLEFHTYSVDNQILCPTTTGQRCKPFQRIWIKHALYSRIVSCWNRILCELSSFRDTEIYERLIIQVSATILTCSCKKGSLTVEITVDQLSKPGWHNRLPLISHMRCTLLCAMATIWKRSASEKKKCISFKGLL